MSQKLNRDCAICLSLGDICVSCEERVAPVPSPGGPVEVLAVVTLGSFSAEELGEIDIQPKMKTLERIQQQVVTNEDVSLELIDGANVTRLQAENAALQQRLSTADQRVDELQAAFKERDSRVTKLAIAAGSVKACLESPDSRVAGWEDRCIELLEDGLSLAEQPQQAYQGIPGTSFQRLNALANEGE